MAKIKIWLLDNPLTEISNDFSARVSLAGSLDLDALVKGVVAKRSEYQEVTIRSIADLLFDEMSEGIKGGYSIHTPLFRAYPAVSGSFVGKTAKFNKDEHSLKINFTPNGEFLSKLQQTEVEVLGITDGVGVIGQVIDKLTGVEDHTITPKDAITIKGSKIKIQGDPSEVGVFLIKKSDGSRIKMQRILENMPSELLVLLPDLEAGDYELEILTQFSGGGKSVKETRTLNFDQVLTVL